MMNGTGFCCDNLPCVVVKFPLPPDSDSDKQKQAKIENNDKTNFWWQKHSFPISVWSVGSVVWCYPHNYLSASGS